MQSAIEGLLSSNPNTTEEDVNEIKDFLDYRMKYDVKETPENIIKRLEGMGSLPYVRNIPLPQMLTDEDKKEVRLAMRRWDSEKRKLMKDNPNMSLELSIVGTESGDYNGESFSKYLGEISNLENTYNSFRDFHKDRPFFKQKSPEEQDRFIYEKFSARKPNALESKMLKKYGYLIEGDIGQRLFMPKSAWDGDTAEFNATETTIQIMKNNKRFKEEYSLMIDTLDILQGVDKDIKKVRFSIEHNKNYKGEDIAFYRPTQQSITYNSNMLPSNDPNSPKIEFRQGNHIDTFSTNWSADGREIISTVTHEYGHHIHNHLLSKGFNDRIDTMYSKYLNNTVSHYATYNSSENFAETFTLYCSGRKYAKKYEPMMKDFEQLMKDSGLTKFKGITKQSNLRKYRYGK